MSGDAGVPVPGTTVPTVGTPSILTQAQKALDASLQALPAHRTGAAALVVTEDGVRLAVATRVERERWELAVAGHVTYQPSAHDLSAGAEVLFSWSGR